MADKIESTKTKTKPTSEVAEKTGKSGSKKGWLWITLGAVLTAIVVVGLVLLKPKPAPDDPKNSPSYSASFFIYANGSYSLWNKDGARLTEDDYDDKSDFVGGYAYVKKGNEYAIIDASGRQTVPFGQISRVIRSCAGLFLIEDNNGGRHLITGANRELLAGEDLQINAPGTKSTFLIAEKNGRYYVFNFAGRLVIDFAKANDEEVTSDTENDFALVYYNETNLLFDTRSGESMAMFNGVRFQIEDVSEDRTAVLLSDYDDGNSYKLVKNGSLYELNEIKYYGMVRGTDILIGFDDSYETIALLDNNYKISRKVPANLALKDANNFAVLNDDGKIEVYQGGNLAKTIEGEDIDLESSVVYDANLYAFKVNGKYGFYRLDGSFAFGEYEKVYSLFDKNNHTSVTEDGENYYMIDANGKRVSDVSYKKFYAYDHSYLVVDANNKRAILNEAGQQVTGFDYTEAYNRSVAVDHEIWSLRKEANKYDVFDALTGKMILTDVNPYDFYANYFTVKNEDDKKEFYTYEGVKFYAEQ